MNKFQLSFLFCFISFSAVNSQSLSERIKTAEDAISNDQIEKGIALYHVIDSLSKLEKDSSAIVLSALVLGDYYNLLGQHDKAKSYFEFASPYAVKPIYIGLMYNGIAMAVEPYDTEGAINYSLKSIAALEKADPPWEQIGTIYGNLGLFMEQAGRYEEAILNFKKALELNPIPIVRMQLNMALGQVLIKVSNWDAAEEYILNAVKIPEEEGYKSRNGLPGVVYARLLIYKEKYPEALDELNKSIAFFIKRDQKGKLAQAYCTKTLLHIKQKEWSRAKEIIDDKDQILPNLTNQQEVEFLHLENHLLERADKYEAIIENGKLVETLLVNLQIPLIEKTNVNWMTMAYDKIGDTKQALKYLKLKETLSDALYRAGQAEYVSKLEAQFNRKEQQREIGNLEFKNKAQQKMLWGGGIFLLLLSIFSWLLYRLWRKVSSQKILISSALDEKDILLRVIHHRVKNNLQLISSLLSLQIDSVSDEQALQAIKEGHSRVQSMALIHQDLYNKENLTEVSGKVYLDKLTRELFATYNIDADRISLKLDIEDLNIDVDTLVPLGLIINELLTNTLKYAFPDDRKGTLSILLKDNDGVLHLRIKDDGVGFNPNEVREGSFGSTLINALIAQLSGDIETNSSKGTETKIVIKNYLQKR